MFNDFDNFKIVYKDIRKKGIQVFWSKTEEDYPNLENSEANQSDSIPHYFAWEIRSKHYYCSLHNYIGPSVSILSTNEIDKKFSPIICFYCGETIVSTDCIKFDGNKCFCNETCFNNRIEGMIISQNYQIDELCTFTAKRYFLNRISQTCNGQLITKILIRMKHLLNQLEFSIVVRENTFLYNHYVAFLRETNQNDELMLWCENKFQEHLRRFRKIMVRYINVDGKSVENFKMELVNFLSEIKPDVDMIYMPIKMISEYLSLLNWQTDIREDLINSSLIETVIKSKASYLAIHDDRRAMFLKDEFCMTISEFFWTSLKPIIEEKNFEEIKLALKRKGFHGKLLVTYERIVAFLVSLNKAPDDFKMKCLLKIPNVNSLIECANLYGFLDYLIKFCKTNKRKKWQKLKIAIKN